MDILAAQVGHCSNLTVDAHGGILHRRRVAQAITDVAGSSAWFERGFITYSTCQAQMLGVSEATLKHGAVSEAVVREMVAGALAQRGEVALAVSGIAGPGAARRQTGRHGVVRLGNQTRRDACATPSDNGDRAEVRAQAAHIACRGVDLLNKRAECLGNQNAFCTSQMMYHNLFGASKIQNLSETRRDKNFSVPHW